MTGAGYAKKANRVLAGVFILFAAAGLARHWYPESLALRVLYAVFEAALVGGIADWFAVTALFRRPLGFPWHTALISRNRDKMIDAIAAAVQNELLSPEAIKLQLAGARLVDLFIGWLDRQDRKTVFHGLIPRYAQRALQEFEPRALVGFAQKLVKRYLQTADLAGKAGQGLRWVLASGHGEQMMDKLLEELTVIAGRDSTREAIRRYLERCKEDATQTWWRKLALDIAELTDTVNLAEAAAALQGELERFLSDLTIPGHPVRRWMDARLAEAVDKLAGDPAWQAGIMAWQQGLAERLDLTEALTSLTESALSAATPAGLAALAGVRAEKLWAAFKTDAALQARVEQRLKLALAELVDIEHNLVAMVVSEALQRLSDRDLNRFIEDKVGEDLAWIRINGSVVGGAVGLLLFFFLNYIYGPWAAPAIRSFFQ